jgi:hypothetical protein
MICVPVEPLNGRFRSSLSPLYLAREKIDGAASLGVVQKPKIKIFLVHKEWRPRNVREPAHELAAAENKIEEFTNLSELFYYSTGMTRRGDYVSWRRHSAGQIHGQKGSGVYFLATCFSAGVQPSFSADCSEMFCPESDPICFATRNNQSRFSAIPSASGTSGVDVCANARLHACTV